METYTVWVTVKGLGTFRNPTLFDRYSDAEDYAIEDLLYAAKTDRTLALQRLIIKDVRGLVRRNFAQELKARKDYIKRNA